MLEKLLSFTGVLCALASFSCSAAQAFDVQAVLEKSVVLQQTRGYVSHHVKGGHTHFDIKAADGTKLEICPHPKMGLLHVMQGDKLPGVRSVVEINLKNEVIHYKQNPFTTFLHANSHSNSGLRHLADKGCRLFWIRLNKGLIQ